MKRFISNQPLIVPTLIFIASLKGISQNTQLTNPDPGQPAFGILDPSKDVFTLSGSRINPYNNPNIEGSPFLLTNWVKGVVNFKNGKQFRNAELQFNLVKNELQFRKKNVPNIFAEPVKEFELFDTSSGITKTAFFRNGYPEFGPRTSNTFYQVLAEGRNIHVLKYISKHPSEIYQYNSTQKMEYKVSEDFYLYDAKNNKLHIINMNVSSIAKALPEYASAIKQLTSEGKNKRLTEEEIIHLISNLQSVKTI